MPVLLDSGSDADVYAFGDTLVLRTYRAGGDVAGEAAIMRHVGRHGFPVPRPAADRGLTAVATP